MNPNQRIGLQLARKLANISHQTINKKGHMAFDEDALYQQLQEHLTHVIGLELGKSFPESIIDPESDQHWRWQLLPERKNLIHSYPAYSIVLLFMSHKIPEAVVVINVATGDEYSAASGQGAMFGNQRIRMSKHPSQQLLYAGDQKLPGTRREIGSPLLSIAQLARGGLNALCYTSLDAFTIACAQLLVQQAGGQCCDLQGQELPSHSTATALLAAEGKLVRKLAIYLNQS